MLAQSPPRPTVHYHCETRRGVVAGGIHETRVAGDRERSTGFCWWNQWRRLARREPLADPSVCLACQQTTEPCVRMRYQGWQPISRVAADCDCKTRRGMTTGGIHETRVAAGGLGGAGSAARDYAGGIRGHASREESHWQALMGGSSLPLAGSCVLGCPMQTTGPCVRMRCVNVLRACGFEQEVQIWM